MGLGGGLDFYFYTNVIKGTQTYFVEITIKFFDAETSWRNFYCCAVFAINKNKTNNVGCSVSTIQRWFCSIYPTMNFSKDQTYLFQCFKSLIIPYLCAKDTKIKEKKLRVKTRICTKIALTLAFLLKWKE